jgi:hypothetical protein
MPQKQPGNASNPSKPEFIRASSVKKAQKAANFTYQIGLQANEYGREQLLKT